MNTMPARYGYAFILFLLFASASPVLAQPSIAEVLAGESLNPTQVDPTILEFLERFNRALVTGDTQAVSRMIDLETLGDEVERCVTAPGVEPVSRQIFDTGYSLVLAGELCRPEFGMAWERMQIKAVAQIKDGHYVVTARHWDSEGYGTKVSWYLRKSDQGMRLYDLDQIDAGARWSHMLASILFQGDNITQETKAAVTLMYGGIVSATQGHMDLGLEKLLEADCEALPEALRGLTLATIGGIYYDRDESERALSFIDRAVMLEPKVPLNHYLRAAILNDLGRYDEALVEADRYSQSVGVDADLLVVVGDAYIGNNEFDTALRAYEKALEDDPQHVEALFNVLYWLDDDQKAKFEPYYLKVDDKTGVGQLLAEYLADSHDPVSLSALIDLHSRLRPEDEWVEAYKPEADTVSQ